MRIVAKKTMNNAVLLVNGEVGPLYISSELSRGEELNDGIDGSAGSSSIDGSVTIDGYIGITCPSEPPLGRRQWYYIFYHNINHCC